MYLFHLFNYNHFQKSVATRVVNAKYVVNCAGLFSDKIARMVDDDSFTILPRLGEYLLFHKKQGFFFVFLFFD